MIYGQKVDLKKLLSMVVDQYGSFYKELDRIIILDVFEKESNQFLETLSKGIRELERLGSVDGKTAFRLYESYGLPFEVIKDKYPEFKKEEFDLEFQRHQEVSRAGAEKKFGGHGLVSGDLTAANEEELKIKTRLHTVTHLLNAALHRVLGDEISQRGSDITIERTRFDFVFGRKLTDEEIKKVEDLVNNVITQNYPITIQEMPLDEAKKSGALFFYQGNYPDVVKVYSIGPSTDSTSSLQAGSGPPFSQELCGGPHVSRAGEIGKFKIVKEESSSAGIRRIRAIVE